MNIKKKYLKIAVKIAVNIAVNIAVSFGIKIKLCELQINGTALWQSLSRGILIIANRILL